MSLHPSTHPPLHSVISILVWRVLFALRPKPLLLHTHTCTGTRAHTRTYTHTQSKGLDRSALTVTRKLDPTFKCSPCTSSHGSAPCSLHRSSRCDEHAKHIRRPVNLLIGEKSLCLLPSTSCLLFLLIRHLNS